MSLNNSFDADEDVVTIKEACEEEIIREEEAIAVLGASDENNCTYSSGYVERQAIFSCVTCDPLKESPAGVCYACCVHCHRGHDLVELYTKRNFCCDCGNSKFDGFKCKLMEEKEATNPKNKYNQNYGGKYCTCERPYPDPEDEIEDEMIQCIICEDWYHSRHLGCLAPAEYAEMACDKCMKEHSFLQFYKEFAVPPVTVILNDETSGEVDVTTSDTSTLQENKNKKAAEEKEHQNNKIGADEKEPLQTCKLKTQKKQHKEISTDELVAVFVEEGWRKTLCQCETCLGMYETGDVSYLINEKDTIQSYEKIGKENVEKVWEEAASTISNMNKVQQVELLQGYHELKSGLQDFVSGYSEGQVIRKADVESFFENLNKQKRRRLDGLPPTHL